MLTDTEPWPTPKVEYSTQTLAGCKLIRFGPVPAALPEIVYFRIASRLGPVESQVFGSVLLTVPAGEAAACVAA